MDQKSISSSPHEFYDRFKTSMSGAKGERHRRRVRDHRAHQEKEVVGYEEEAPVNQLNNMAINDYWEQTLPLADENIIITNQGRFRIQKIESDDEQAAPQTAPRAAQSRSPPPRPPSQAEILAAQQLAQQQRVPAALRSPPQWPLFPRDPRRQRPPERPFIASLPTDTSKFYELEAHRQLTQQESEAYGFNPSDRDYRTVPRPPELDASYRPIPRVATARMEAEAGRAYSDGAVQSRFPHNQQRFDQYYTKSTIEGAASKALPQLPPASPPALHGNQPWHPEGIGIQSSKSLPLGSPRLPRESPPVYDKPQPNPIDTETPVFVPHSPDMPKPAPTVVSETSSFSTITPKTPQGEGERPGEKLVFEKTGLASANFDAQSLQALITVYRNTITGDLRCVTTTGKEGAKTTETHRIRASEAKFVPLYAYDFKQRNLVYFEDGQPEMPGRTNPNPIFLSPIYEFDTSLDALDFQGKLLDEEVIFDISNIRSLKLQISGSHIREIDGPRIQIWHQERSAAKPGGENASFVTSGTALSAPTLERTVLRNSRLMIFLGRSQEFMTLFITDDVTIRDKGTATVEFLATKYAGMDRWKSRKGIRCKLERSDTRAAGFRLDREGLKLEDEDSWDNYKTFEMSFENDQGRKRFKETWEYVLKIRRTERLRLKKIQNDLMKHTYSGAVATKVF